MQYRAMKDGVFEPIKVRDLLREWTIPNWYFILLAVVWSIVLITSHGWAIL